MIKRGVTFLVLMVLVLSASGASAQWEVFEHRYDYKPSDVFDAPQFVQKDGYWEARKSGKVVGYVFLSLPWTKKLLGYSGKHLETLVGMDTAGNLTGVKVVFHSEPIVLIGLKEKSYKDFIKQYKGLNIKKNISVGKEISMDAITGATITAIVQNAIITGSARQVASKSGMLKYGQKSTRSLSDEFTALGWDELLAMGAVKNIRVTNKEVGIKGGGLYLDLYFGLVTPVSVGKNLLGAIFYKDVMDRLEGGESAIFIASSGPGSFKGSGFARGGIFDRFNLEQRADSYVFKDRDYRIFTRLMADGAPDIREAGVFLIRGGTFDQISEFRFNLVMPYRVKFNKKFKSFSSKYTLPGRFVK